MWWRSATVFAVVAAELGQPVTVVLVEWLAPVSIGVAGDPALLSSLAILALRRISAVGVRG
jgi:hypothetical protein